MTANQLLYYFKEKSTEHKGIKDIPTYTIEYYLTEAQKKIISELLREGYDRNEFTRRMLQPLVRNYNLTPATITTTPLYTNADLTVEIFQFSSPVRHILNEVCDITFNSNSIYDGMSVTLSRVKPIREGYFNANLFNPYKKPDKYTLWRLEEYNTEVTVGVTIIGNKEYDINRYKARVIKTPEDIKILGVSQQTAELHSDLHEDIVNRAVQIALSAYQQKEA